MKNIRYFIISLAAVATTSCTFLDTYPEDFLTPDDFYETPEELESALLGVYATLAEGALYGNNMLGRMGLSADIGYERYTFDESSVGYYDVSTADSKILGYWRELYDGIGRANVVLANIDRPADMEPEQRSLIEAQARFLRAYYHFMLTIRFGDIPLILSVPEDGSKEHVQIPQTPQRNVYNYVISEMEAVAEQLPDASSLSGGGQLSKSAAYGILARVAMYMAGNPLNEPGMYAKGKEYAKRVIDYGFHRLNPVFSDIFMNYIQDRYDIAESIFEVEFSLKGESTYALTAGQVGRMNGIYYYTVVEGKNHGQSLGAQRASSYYYELFDASDVRRDWTIATYEFSSDTGDRVDIEAAEHWRRCCGKFRREYELTNPKDQMYTPINFPILRYSDVLLMYAECVAADSGSTGAELQKAYEYVNMVRRRGHGLDANTPDASVDLPVEDRLTLLEEIKDERARELGFELLRKDDLIRWGELYDRMRAVRATIPEHYVSSWYVAARLYYGNVSRRDVLWPIPAYEMGVNHELVQNDGF